MRKQLFFWLFALIISGVVEGQNLSIISASSPLDNYCVAGSNISVSFTIFNNGASAVNTSYTYGYSYSYNGGPPVVVTQNSSHPTDNIGAFGTKAPIILTGANLSAFGTYTFKFFVTYGADPVHANDTLTKIVSNAPATIAGSILTNLVPPLQDDTVCTGANSDTLWLSGNVGLVEDWIKSTNGGTTWTPVNGGTPTTDTFFVYNNLTQTTLFSATVRSGGCASVDAVSSEITVDAATIPGIILGTGNVCIGSNGTLNLSGNNGTVVDWATAQNSAGPWTLQSNPSGSLSYTNIQTTDDTLFKVYSQLGVCPIDSTPVAALLLDKPSVGGAVSQKTGNDTVCASGNSGSLRLTGHTGATITWEKFALGDVGFSTVLGPGLDTVYSFSNIDTTTTYRAKVVNGTCAAATSSTFVITVDQATNAKEIEGSASSCSPMAGNLNIKSGFIGGVVQWESSPNNFSAPITIISNTTANLAYSGVTNQTYYRALVKNGVCASQYTSPVGSVTPLLGAVPGTISFNSLADTVICTGASAILNYSGGTGQVAKWQISSDGVSFADAPGVNTNLSYTYTGSTVPDKYFRVSVVNGTCTVPAVYSDTALVKVLPPSAAGTINGAATITICQGSSTTMTLGAHTGTINYWKVSTDGGTTFQTVPGSAGQNSISPTVSVNSKFYVNVQNGECDTAITPVKTVNVNLPSVAGTITGAPGSALCGNSNLGTLTVTGNTGTTIRWDETADTLSAWTLNTATGVNRNFTNLTQTRYYRARVKNGACPEDTTSVVTINVLPEVDGGTASLVVPSQSTICADSIIVTTTLGTTLTGSVLSWEFSTNGGGLYTVYPFLPSNATTFGGGLNYTTNTLWRANVQNGGGCPIVKSNPVAIAVSAPSVGGTTSGDEVVCSGSNNDTVILTGQVGSIFWQSSTSPFVKWKNETPPATPTLFKYSGLAAETWFRAAVVNGSCDTSYSDTSKITMAAGFSAGQVDYLGTGNVCSGVGNNKFSLKLLGSSGSPINWQRANTPAGPWIAVSPAVASINFTDSDRVVKTYYRVIVGDPSPSACPNAASLIDSVLVDAQSVAGTISGSANLCDTNNSGMILITGYTGSISGWRSRVNGGAFTGPFSPGQDTINYSGLSAGLHEYEALVKSGVCPEDTTVFATLDVDPDVVAGTLSGGATYCTTTNSTFMQVTGYVDSVITWEQSVNGGLSWLPIAGTVGRDTVTFVNITSPTMYRVIVTSGNGNCGTDTSNIQSIGVGLSIGGTLNSNNAVCISGHSALLQLTGYTGLVVNWQDSASGGSWTTIGNSGIDTLRYTNLITTTSYRVIVQSGSCTADTSTIATITVSDTVFAGTLNQNLTFCDTVNNDTLLLTGYFGPILNWQSAIDGAPFTDFSPSKTDSAFIFTNLQDSITEYRVVMNGGVCGNDTSNIVSVQVGASLGGILLSGDTVCSGNNGGVIHLTSYRGAILGWDSSTVSGIFAPITNTTDSLVYLNLDDTVTYRVRIQNPGCPPDTSDSVTIVTIPGTFSGILAGSRSICSSTNTDSVILNGRQGDILLWEFSTNGGSSWDTLIGQATDTFIFNNLLVSTLYRVVIDSAGNCPRDTSNIVSIQIGPSDAGFISGDTQLCANSLADLFLNAYTGDSIGWEFSVDGGIMWMPIPASDTNHIKFLVNNTTDFRAIVQSDTCDSDTSASYQIKVDLPYTAGFITPTTQLCYGIGSDTIALAGAVDTVYDWEFRQDTVASFTSLGNTDTLQTYDTLKITHHYRVFVQVGVCPVDTASITLTVDTFTVAGSITGDDTICSGTNNGVITLSGYLGNTFTWESSLDSISWSGAAGATNDTFYVYNNLNDTTYYRLIVASGGCPSDTTNGVLIVVKPSAVAGILTADTSYCEGPNGGVLNLNGSTGSIIDWEESIGGGAFSAVSPQNTTDSLLYSNIDTTTSYRVIVGLGDCPNDTSNLVTITILQTPLADITAGGPTEFCEGGSVSLIATGGPDYLWSTTDTIDQIGVTVSGTYFVTVTDTITGCFDSDTAVVTVFPLPTVDAGTDVTITDGQSTILNASGASLYEWTPKTSLSDGFISNPSANPSITITYYVTGTDENGCTGTDSVIVTVEAAEDSTEVTQFSNLFTPNGDGHNDYWRITDLAQCNTCQVVIFNRYGQEILKDDNYQDNWTGDFNGKKLPDGTYYYVVKTETNKIYKGAITILRGE